jgi:glutamate-ammonia-ligase adenylyltransferase
MGTLPRVLTGRGRADWREAAGRAIEAAPSPEMATFGLERLVESAGLRRLTSWPRAELDALCCVLGSGPALVRALLARGESWPELAASYSEPNPGIAKLVQRGRPPRRAEAAELMRRIRELVREDLFRLGARDLYGLATLQETVEGVTELAEAALRIAVAHQRALLARDMGDPVDEQGRPVGFCVIGLGKLGGRDLNYSSDIDLMYLYESDEVHADSIAPREFFSRLASEVSKAVGEVTADGFGFRVDLRLRPEGNSGALVNTVRNALTYYEGWGATWERGVLIKARPVAGDLAVGNRFSEAIRPFVFRRHLDYQTVTDFRDMKDRIDAEQSMREGRGLDVKLGTGGIRELEFVVQILQLIHGGHRSEVSVRGTMPALAALESSQLIAPSDAAALREAYRFLRDVEHAVQIVDQRQTQELPSDTEELRWLARRLGYGTGRRGRPATGDELESFRADWQRHTQVVHEAFLRFLELRTEDEGEHTAKGSPAVVAMLGRLEAGDLEGAAAMLVELGFEDGGRAATILEKIYRQRIVGPASPQRRRAVQAMAPALVEAVTGSADAMNALERMVGFLVRTGAHTSYLALLSGSPATMKLLVDLFATSPFLAAHLVGHPELIDSLVRADAAGALVGVDAYYARLREELDGVADEEDILAVLRRFRTSELVRIGMTDLADTTEPDEVHARLSDLAEACLRAAAECARDLALSKTDAKRTKLAIVALGKMGGREMSYGSDLDLLFVYDPGKADYDADAHINATRWAQKLLSLLQTTTQDGFVYKIDSRLRPSGRQGPLVTSLGRYETYHRKEAELWERQAHLRARVVFGAPKLAKRIQRITQGFVYEGGLAREQAAEIHELRVRMERELGSGDPDRENIKTGRGGIVDIEFVVQMLQLRFGDRIAELRTTNTREAIGALAEAGKLTKRDARSLAESYTFLRRLEARMRLERDRPVEELGTDPQVVAPLAKRMGFRGRDAGRALLERYEQTRGVVRQLYAKYFEIDRKKARS